ncbi:ABC transporter permease subunit [Pontibacillus yanchengensis]|uniref:ABC transporter permease subunit n=2 Tax=Pontibacillus yanchengensis TaxID=462910 RepID=A0ACC7VIF9_9BACI|nr:ABC transporter permease [Pontibacillus yanchengensis]MYL34879.1 ABC transporter permease subunit [Pontibacillus yanchengensis]MYL54746.1 ABC transporter permease subunit [Pontibacillus yanchengensis]
MSILALIKRILRQFKRDKRSLALLIMAPLLVLTLMWLVFEGDRYEPNIAVVDVPQPFVDALEEQDASIETMTEEEAMEALEDVALDAMISMDQQKLSITLEGSDPSTNQAVKMTLQNAMKELSPQSNKMELSFSYLHGSEDLGLFDNVGPVLIGFFVFFFVFIIGGVSFLRERTQGTLERLLSTPLKRSEVVSGYVLGFGIFTLLQSLIIAAYSIYVLGMWMEGSFGYVLLITFLLAMTALTLGTLLSAYASNEFQMIQFIPLVIVPQVFFSGLFSLETMAPWLRWIGQVMPLTYGADALREIMIRGKGFEAFQTDVYILIGFAVLFYVLNIVALKKHRKL